MSSAQDEFNELMRDKERRSGHPEDDNNNDDARSFLNLSDEDDDDDDDDDRTPPASRVDPDEDAPRPSMSQSRNTIPLTRYQANTGPKGVISDAQNFRDSRRNHRISMRSSSNLASQAQSGLRLEDVGVPPVVEKVRGSDEEDGEEGEEDDDDEFDDDFMSKWRNTRLRELQRGGARDSRMHTRKRSARLWGTLATVDGEGYLDAVDRSPAETVVVVYIYDDYSEVSNAIEECLRALARKYLETRFVKLHYQDAEMEPAGIPALLAYRGGDKFAGLVPVIQEIPEDADLTASTLEKILQRHQILR